MSRLLRPQATGRFVIVCDHASNFIPPELDRLGLPDLELTRHIAWDIGAAGIAEELSDIFDSPAVLCETSRLVIDCNRQLNARDLIPRVSDGTTIPGNLNLDAQAKQRRIDRWFTPYHDDVEQAIAARGNAPTILLSVHTMTDNMAGVARPWQISLSSHLDRSLADPLLTALRAPGDITVGDNQPYNLDPAVDYSTPVHAVSRGLPHIQVEFRQDEVATPQGQTRWARRFAQALGMVTPSSR